MSIKYSCEKGTVPKRNEKLSVDGRIVNKRRGTVTHEGWDLGPVLLLHIKRWLNHELVSEELIEGQSYSSDMGGKLIHTKRRLKSKDYTNSHNCDVSEKDVISKTKTISLEGGKKTVIHRIHFRGA